MLALSVGAACAGTLAALRALRAHRFEARPTFGLIGAGAVLVLAAALSWPVVFSSDVYAYAAYGDEALRGIDPYAPLPAHLSDPFLAAARWQWSGTFPVCVYGAAFVSFARTLVALTRGFDVRTTLFAFRFAGCLAFLIGCACLYFLLPRPRGECDSRNVAVAALALNPVALWTVAEGHNDALMVAFALAGAAFAARGFPALGGVAMGLASLIKLPGLAIGLAVALSAEFRASGRMQRMWPALATGALFVAVFALPRALEVARRFNGHAHYAPQFSLQTLAGDAVGALGAAPLVGTAAALLLCAALAVFGIALALRGDTAGIAWIGIAVWLAIPNPYPWYGLWVLPLAVLALERAPFAALWAATISIVVRYLPDAYGSLLREQQIVIALVTLAPLLFALRNVRAFRSREELATS